MAEVRVGSVPFQEAIAHFQDKLKIPTQRWDDMMGEPHAKGFTVAGATSADLLSDFYAAVDKAISQGLSIGDFRKDFDKIVAEHGWVYKGNRGWRTRVIYDTNLRTAHMAGKWQQFQQAKDTRPYLQYLTAGDARVRPQHAAWDRLVLPIDDAWWDTHYPPNGWGCRCTVRSLSKRQLERDGLAVAEAPKVETTERINTQTGEVYGEVPEGIDTGWDYNVGKAWLGPDIAFGEKLMSMPVVLRNPVLNFAKDLAPHLQQAFAPWVTSLMTRKQPLGEIKTVGYLSPRTIDALVQRGETPTTAVITVTDKDVMHMLRDAKTGKHIPEDHIRTLPDHITNPKAVLLDKRDQALLYVFDVPGERVGKLVVRVNYKTKARGADGSRHSVQTNSIRTGGLVEVKNLKDQSFYEVIEGQL